MNLTTTIVPKSDQLNADDLIGGPRTITITAVESGSAEQPVAIRYQSDNGRPYKPSKSMRRVLVSAWGADGNAYVGRRATLYRDPNIKFGGEAVGGICISHLSDIPEPLQIALTVTRGKRKPFHVEPLAPDPADVGNDKAREGVKALQEWWATLPNPVKHGLKENLMAWKQTAESVDSQKAVAQAAAGEAK